VAEPITIITLLVGNHDTADDRKWIDRTIPAALVGRATERASISRDRVAVVANLVYIDERVPTLVRQARATMAGPLAILKRAALLLGEPFARTERGRINAHVVRDARRRHRRAGRPRGTRKIIPTIDEIIAQASRHQHYNQEPGEPHPASISRV